jgi:hypothetical protein
MMGIGCPWSRIDNIALNLAREVTAAGAQAEVAGDTGRPLPALGHVSSEGSDHSS